MRRKKTPSQQRADDRRGETATSMQALKPPEDGGNVPWEEPEPRYDPDKCPIGYPEFTGRTWHSLIDEIQNLRVEVRDRKRELRNLREQVGLVKRESDLVVEPGEEKTDD